MAEEEPKAPKKVKKTAVPEKPAEPKGPLPKASEIRAAKKAELVAWSDQYELSTEGKVDDLRKRLLGFVAKEEAKAARDAEKAEKAEAVEGRAKPKLDDRLKHLLALRSAKNAARPKFRRQEWHRYRMFGDEWRKPQGGQSKLRRHFGYRWNLPSIGYRGPRAVRGLHPSGFQEILVHNERQIEGLDATKQAVRIARGVGARKREIIEKACDDKGLRVLNRMVTE
jgi:large subunit ribosomal protein L32e